MADKQPQETESQYDDLIDAVLRLGRAGDALNASGLKRRAVLLLLKDMTKVSMEDIDTILDALPKLPAQFLTPAGFAAAHQRRKERLLRRD